MATKMQFYSSIQTLTATKDRFRDTLDEQMHFVQTLSPNGYPIVICSYLSSVNNK